jgi:ComF family protein
LPQSSGILCPNCVSWPAAIEGIRSPFRFDGVTREAVHQLKYKNLRAAAGLLAGWLAEYLAEYPLPGEVLAPVPLHPKRLRERGYNQSALLAEELGKLTGLPVCDNSLIRTTYLAPQAKTSSVTERRRNAAGSFACRDRQFEGRSVLLIDDVATTGSTLDDCARALKASGAASVWGLTLAREV